MRISSRVSLLLLAFLLIFISLADSKLTEALKVESLVLETDTQGNVWPSSPVTVVFNKRVPEEWLKRNVQLSPSAPVDVAVTTTGRWSRKTQLTINPSKDEVFATDSVYSLEMGQPRLSFDFETIPTPRVADVRPSGRAVKTADPLVVTFDRPMRTTADIRVTANPDAPLDPLWYGDRVLVLGHPRLRTSTNYQFVLSAGMEDAEGHPMQDEYRFGFRTVDPPTVAEFGPQGERVGLRDALRVVFSTGVDRKSVEAAFKVEPATPGSFEWPDGRTLVWHPRRLRPGQSHRVRVSGLSKDGDPVVPAEWQFRTIVPPPRVTPGGGGKLVLTFDDDPPTIGRANALLDILAQHGVRAIFFPTGAWAAANPDFVRRARAEGHLICNHTYRHADLTALSLNEVRFQILSGAGRDQCNLLRPPYGAHNRLVDATAASLGYRIFMWDVDTRDWTGLSAQRITNIVLGGARPGAVVLFHTHAAHTLTALPNIINRLKKAGYALTY